MKPLAPVTNTFFIMDFDFDGKGTIKRVKKQRKFEFSEREYLRPEVNGTIKRVKKQRKFEFSEY